jgi:Na+/proline symporter
VSRAQVLYLHICVALTALTGVAFAWMKYAMHSDDEFSVVNHPLQPHMLSAHVVIAPFLVFAFGWIFSDHIWPRFRQTGVPRRASGVWSMMAIVPMTLSAYLLQIATNESLRKAMAIAHWVTSGVFVLAYVAHLVTKPMRKPKPQD